MATSRSPASCCDVLCLQYSDVLNLILANPAGTKVETMQRLCGCVASPGVSAPLRVLKLGPAADGALADDFGVGTSAPHAGGLHAALAKAAAVLMRLSSAEHAVHEHEHTMSVPRLLRGHS